MIVFCQDASPSVKVLNHATLHSTAVQINTGKQAAQSATKYCSNKTNQCAPCPLRLHLVVKALEANVANNNTGYV